MKTIGEAEAAISEAISRFQQEHIGRGPQGIQTYILHDFIVVRLRGALTVAEQHLVKSLSGDTGRRLLKEVRAQLVEAARPALEQVVRDVVAVSVVSLHHDISTVTGEEVFHFSLVSPPVFRDGKRK